MESSETNTQKIQRINNTTLSYLAGMLDGEGSIIVNWSGKYPAAKIVMGAACRGLLEWLQSMLGGSIMERKPNALSRRPYYEWRCGETVRALKLLKPFIRMKRPQLEVALAMMSLPYGSTDKKTSLAHKLEKLNQDRVHYSWRQEK